MSSPLSNDPAESEDSQITEDTADPFFPNWFLVIMAIITLGNGLAFTALDLRSRYAPEQGMRAFGFLTVTLFFNTVLTFITFLILRFTVKKASSLQLACFAIIGVSLFTLLKFLRP